MVILLNGEVAKASLPDVSAGVVVLMVAADMGGQQPRHVMAQLAVVERPKNEVKMVGHQAIRQQPHVGVFTGLAQQLDEGGVIAILAKDRLAAVAPVEYMVAVAALGSACMSRHAGIIARGTDVGKGKCTVSPFLVLFLSNIMARFDIGHVRQSWPPARCSL
jgi:hypothetical protein